MALPLPFDTQGFPVVNAIMASGAGGTNPNPLTTYLPGWNLEFYGPTAGLVAATPTLLMAAPAGARTAPHGAGREILSRRPLRPDAPLCRAPGGGGGGAHLPHKFQSRIAWRT